MPANQNRTTYPARQASALSRSCSCDAALTAEELALLDEEPMRRYPHPIPMCSASPAAAETSEECAPAMSRVLEELSCQSQLLVDLLGAVNSLTAALLAREDKS